MCYNAQEQCTLKAVRCFTEFSGIGDPAGERFFRDKGQFMNNSDNSENQESARRTRDYARHVVFAGFASVCVAGILIAAKLLALVLTNSASMMASLTDSLMDVMASVVNLMALRYAVYPADEEHRYGHWKAEALAGLVQSAFIIGSSVFLLINGCISIASPRPLASLDAGIWVTVFAMAISVVLVCYQSYVIRKTSSTAIQADRLHYASDILFNAGVLVSLVFSYFGFLQADGFFAVILSLYIIYGGISIGKKSLASLLDSGLPPKDVSAIYDLLLDVPEIRGIHDLRTRAAGPRIFIQAHVEIARSVSLETAHNAADAAEANVLRVYPDADITLHMEPVRDDLPKSPFMNNPEGSEKRER